MQAPDAATAMEVPMLTIDEAAAILKGPRKPGIAGFIEYSNAATVYYALHEQRAGRGHRLHSDDLRSRVRDQPPNIRGTEPIPFSEQCTEMGSAPGGRAGARKIMKLDGAASAYIVITDATGATWLCYAGKSDGVMDPGETTGGRQRLTDAKFAATMAKADLVIDMLEKRRQQPKAIAARDAAWSRNQLHAIQESNKKFWRLP